VSAKKIYPEHIHAVDVFRGRDGIRFEVLIYVKG